MSLSILSRYSSAIYFNVSLSLYTLSLYVFCTRRMGCELSRSILPLGGEIYFGPTGIRLRYRF